MADDDLVYSQDNAPDSISDMLMIITREMNKEFKGILKVNIDYNGDAINAVVGRHLVRTHLKRKVGGGTVQECFDIVVVINDVDECLLAPGHPWYHNCHGSALCRNTVGSYECACAAGRFGVRGSGAFARGQRHGGACHGQASTEACCVDHDQCMDDECEKYCKSNFQCTDKACHANNCSPYADCIEEPGFQFSCACKPGYVGDGVFCEKYVPEEVNYCRPNTCDKDCVCTQDKVAETYTCQPKPGYVSVDRQDWTPSDHVTKGGRRADRATCVDGYVPEIHINGANPMRLKQGDLYEELGVKVVDKNKQGSKRLINIDYSDPLLGGPLEAVGTFTVFYALDTPWLPVEHVTKKRMVIVDDIDECAYAGPLADFQHQCLTDGTARCHNTVGSYNCSCLPGYQGDGFRPANAHGRGGEGCADVTPPVLQCRGAGCRPRAFKACNCVGLVDEAGAGLGMEDKVDAAFIGTALAKVDDFCEDPPCFTAYDATVAGTVDLTPNITRGALERVPGANLTWRVPYGVRDAAGNPSNTLYHYVQVELVDVLDTLGSGELRVPARWSRWVLLLAALLLLLALWFLTSYLLHAGRAARLALQYVLCPYSMMARREDFERGMDLVLWVMSFGLLDAKARARRVAAQWTVMVNKLDGEED